MRTRTVFFFVICAGFTFVSPLRAQQVPVEEYVLANGMKLLMVPRKGDPNVAAGWVAKVGSVNERPGITGLSHLFEHMMFKGTRTIGTTDIKKDLEIMERMDAVKLELRKAEQEQIRRLRLGEIDDLKDPKNRTPQYQALLKELEKLEKEEKELTQEEEFARQGAMKRPSFLSEYLYLLRTNRKWWMLPLIFLLLVFGVLMILASTGAAPFIYTLF